MKISTTEIKTKLSVGKKFPEKSDANRKSVNIFDILRKVEELIQCKQRLIFTELFDGKKNPESDGWRILHYSRKRTTKLQNSESELTKKNPEFLTSMIAESDVCGILHEFTKYEKRKTKISEKEETAPSKIRQSKVGKSISLIIAQKVSFSEGSKNSSFS